MTTTTHSDFGVATEAGTVAAAFSDRIKDCTILITGVNKQGIGYATAEALASQSPRCLILAGRSTAKLQECVDALRLQYPGIDYRPLRLDLSSQKATRAAAAEVLSWEDVPSINIIINNAGVMNLPERKFSEDGVEFHLATNHVGHFLFTNLVMPKIITAAKKRSAGSVRVVNVSSMAIMVSALRCSDVQFDKPASELPENEKPSFKMMQAASLNVNESMSYIPMAAYGQSKTANVLYSVGLNQRLYDQYGVLAIALNPGEVMTELQRHTDPDWLKTVESFREKMKITMKTPGQGASTTLVGALDPKLTKPESDGRGQFLIDCQIGTVVPYSVDKNDAAKLWKMTEGWVGESFSW